LILDLQIVDRLLHIQHAARHLLSKRAIVLREKPVKTRAALPVV
jgi:hypothetical protein